MSSHKSYFVFETVNKYKIPSSLIILTLLIYWQVIYHDFINLDTPHYILFSEHVHNGLTFAGIKWAFCTFHMSNWHPVTWLSHMLDVELFGVDPGMHHAVNVLIHTVNVLLLYYLMLLIIRNAYIALFISVSFAIHPCHVESVAWVAERKDVLSTLFFLLTIILYYRYTLRPSLVRYISFFLTTTIGLMTKPMLVTMPFVLLLFDYWPLNRSGSKQHVINEYIRILPRLVVEKAPLFLLVAISSVITFKAQQAGGAMDPGVSLDLINKVGNAVIAYVAYIKNLFIPIDLALFYPHPGQWPIGEIIACASLLAIITIYSVMVIERQPYVFVGWAFFLGTLFPVIGIVQVGAQFMADRYTYIPFIGLFIAIGFLIRDIMNKYSLSPSLMRYSSILFTIIFSITSALYISKWENSITIWTHSLLSTDKNYLYLIGLQPEPATQDPALKGLYTPYFLLAEEYYAIGAYRLSTIHYIVATNRTQDNPEGYFNLGKSLLALGELEMTFVAFDHALKLDPDNKIYVRYITDFRNKYESLIEQD